ncbi:MAG: L-seryl-tRNA(Sec) selenium transferase [Sulfuricella sp.]|nr:L-seryl-tRNA(Sec) selenium transferase [Sulfuricella sp.]
MTNAESLQRLAALPAVYEILAHPRLEVLSANIDHDLLVAGIQARLAFHREVLRNGPHHSPPSADELAQEVALEVEKWHAPGLEPVINLTGTLLHTNLGRAPLSAAAIAALVRAAGSVNLEYDLDAGKRGDRDSVVEALLTRLTGAEAATVVNNNAAALYLALNTLANKRRVVVSRGELVEIGASFRMPDIIRASGCRLMEVGTTNRTHLADYRQALDEGGQLLLKVHTSNYRVVGFASEVSLAELVKLGRERNVPVVADLGSGALVDVSRYGVPDEPLVQDAVRAGADLVTFSGDKLLGGPQSGVIVGRSPFIKRVKRNPMKRALRCDKLVLGALDATLAAYLSPQTLEQNLPTYRMLSRSLAEIETLARQVQPPLERWAQGRAKVELLPSRAQVGSGAAPDATLPSLAFALTPLKGSSATQLARALRQLSPPVIGRLHDGGLLLDLRALLDPERLISALSEAPP